jgi:hypothetical protein
MTVVTAQQTQTHRQRLCGQNEKFFNGKTEHAVSTAPCKFSHKYVANLKICSVQSDVSVGHFFCDVLVLTLWDRAETHDEAWRWSALLVVNRAFLVFEDLPFEEKILWWDVCVSAVGCPTENCCVGGFVGHCPVFVLVEMGQTAATVHFCAYDQRRPIHHLAQKPKVVLAVLERALAFILERNAVLKCDLEIGLPIAVTYTMLQSNVSNSRKLLLRYLYYSLTLATVGNCC